MFYTDTDSTQQRKQAHIMLDLLPQEKLSAVVGLLQVMLDPVACAVANAPNDDEPVTEEEAKALTEADEWLKHNQPIPHEDVLAEFGLTMADWEKMGQESTQEEPRRNG
jgi:hypothetical protein